MDDDMVLDALNCALEAVNNYTSKDDMVEHVKTFFDDAWQPDWACIAGEYFECCLPLADHSFIAVKIDRMTFLLFKKTS
ncbi:hypothetical protein D918_04869 [Trichuris suis]|nr:hypothetical protein D918_04869 [Trichuris suis]